MFSNVSVFLFAEQNFLESECFEKMQLFFNGVSGRHFGECLFWRVYGFSTCGNKLTTAREPRRLHAMPMADAGSIHPTFAPFALVTFAISAVARNFAIFGQKSVRALPSC